jgi:hypothetical protein
MVPVFVEKCSSFVEVLLKNVGVFVVSRDKKISFQKTSTLPTVVFGLFCRPYFKELGLLRSSCK